MGIPNESSEPPAKRLKQKQTDDSLICIIHFHDINHGAFKFFRDDKNANSKITKILEVKQQRIAEHVNSNHRMQEQCSLIPGDFNESHGYHWNCYKRFTGNLNRLQKYDSKAIESTSDQNDHRSRRRTPFKKDHIIFNPDCLFCESDKRKAVKVKGSWNTQGLSRFGCDGWESVQEAAESKKDEKLLTRIRGHDLYACEAQFHRKCLIDYLQSPEKWRSEDAKACQMQESLVQAHQRAFQNVCNSVEINVLEKNKLVKLSELQKIYTESLDESEHSNPRFRNENLKAKLIKKYNNQIMFCEMGSSGKYQSSIVFNSSLDIKTAVMQAYVFGSSDAIKDVGNLMHNKIAEFHEKSPDIKWPLTPKDLENLEIPEDLTKLLSYIICGKNSPTSPRVHRLVYSIGQDICRASTNGEWKLRKHIMLVMSLRHLFRSKGLINLLHRLGHCESYEFSLELETALAEAVVTSSSTLSNQIIRSSTSASVFHSEFDNFDKLLNDMTGKGSIHTAHGIMLQEVSDKTVDLPDKQDLPSLPRSKRRSLSLTHEPSLPDCYISLRRNPPCNNDHLEHHGGKQAINDSMKMNILWVMLRMLGVSEAKPVPGWTGFLSSTEKSPLRLTAIDYYPVINHPITEYKTVQECLRVAEEATKEVGQGYVITTFDLGVCMKAFPLMWQNPEKYRDHVILIGTFHLECAFMKMLGKKMKGSGL